MVNVFIEKFKNLIKRNKKTAIILFIGFTGILLICLSETADKKASAETTVQNTENNTEYLVNLEERLTDIISSIEDAGEVKVMITLKCSDENVYAVNENIKNDESSNNYSNNYVIIDNRNEKEGIRLKVLEPEIKGVAVVCSGGDNPAVTEQIIKTVTTVLGIGSNNVSVSKMK